MVVEEMSTSRKEEDSVLTFSLPTPLNVQEENGSYVKTVTQTVSV